MSSYKFLLFGTGEYYKRYREWFLDKDVLALIDNSPEKQGALIDGVEVRSPEEAVKLDYDYIVVLSFYITEMRNQLISLGVPKEKVLHFYQLNKVLDLKKQFEYTISDSAAQKKILLLSHDLTLGGPALALSQAAQVLVKHGFHVVCASPLEGPMREVLSKMNVDVIVDSNLQIGNMQEITWTHQFDLVVCNTINFNYFLSKRPTEIPIIWWLHDAIFFYEGIEEGLLENLNIENMKVLAVSKISSDAMHVYRPEIPIAKLVFAVEDEYKSDTKTADEKIVFDTIGYIESRKGQDILIDAIEQIPDELNEKAEYILIGHDKSVFADKIKERIKNRKNIHIRGIVNRQEIDKQLSRADALIVPSREEPLSMVSVEAMMHEVPVIVSDIAGVAEYIHSGDDGFIVKTLDVNELKEKIEWAITHRDELRKMGTKARKVYEDSFSFKVFEENLLKTFFG